MLKSLILVCVALAAGSWARNVDEWEALMLPSESAPTCHCGTPAFYAYLGGDVSLNAHAVIMFNVEETDTSNSYNILNGRFTAPVSGVYVFSFTIYSSLKSYVGAELIVNDVIKGEAFADSEEINDTHSASATIVVQMTAGQQAYVRRGLNSQSGMWSHASRGRSSFSGWLLR
ncbi:complement C1q tumor necrosis factor-related protein 3-like [Mya arenaria]|nr:complement C1q tumor necrosis factor-related protein 3-like [Mya arenaria]